MGHNDGYDIPVYSRTARSFHWLVALLILIQLPIGFYMMYRAKEMPGVNDKGEPVVGVWNGVQDGGLTDTLFSGHKVLGIFILLLVVLRLLYRLTKGAPRSDPGVPAALTGLSHVVHWSIYLLLLAVPIIGYFGISYGGYLDVFGVHLPEITMKDEKFSEEVFEWHEIAATVLAALVAIHFAAALFHKFVRRDRVVERMLPKRTV